MDWDLKVPASWDLAELEHEPGAAATTTPAAAGPSGVRHVNAAANGARPECSVDLKLGGLGECEPGHGADRRREPAVGKTPAPASPGVGAAKRPRQAGGGGAGQQQCPSCAVDGCEADLSKCRDYHRRHKVCEAHSKTPVVVVASREMRFCQQCSRFHLLAEFDETKRSCRKRLDGHNRRRRKPQPDPMTSASFITSQQGTRFSRFASPRPEANWPGIIKPEESPYYTHHQIPLGTSNRQQHLVGSTSAAYTKEGRRFPFLQEGEISFATGVVLEASVCQPLLKTVAAPPPESGGGGGDKMFSDGLMTRVLDSDCVLSLLSAPSNSSGIDVSRMVRPTEQVPMALSGLQFGGSSWFSSRPQAAATGGTVSTTTPGLESEQQQQQLNTVLGLNDNEMNYNGMFHVGGDGSSDGTSSSLPFSWQ